MGMESLVRGMFYIPDDGKVVATGTWIVDYSSEGRRYVFLTDDGCSHPAGLVGEPGGFRPHIRRVAEQIAPGVNLEFRLL